MRPRFYLILVLVRLSLLNIFIGYSIDSSYNLITFYFALRYITNSSMIAYEPIICVYVVLYRDYKN